MKPQRARFLIAAVVVLMASMYGACSRVTDQLPTCGKLNASVPASIKMERMAACGQLLSSRVDRLTREMKHLRQILKLNGSTSRNLILNLNFNPTPSPQRSVVLDTSTLPTRTQGWWMEPWFKPFAGRMLTLVREYSIPFVFTLFMGLICLAIGLLPLGACFLDAMDEREGSEKVKLVVKILAAVALATLVVNGLIQLVYIVIMLA
ncbi:uncharacterized protein LOC129581401 [Paramacrobiotus metropolitanus]|uniref:uncharacterized protein LOC129581401 n=1 Tax=Paramacrobiotus metropolitanus TaxID=2943436 RepID=UPI002445CE4C|nr:uncharacterized protein LOC129581401 [Paramacrobiotus metropolitanus]